MIQPSPNQTILLVEDNEQDELLTLRALQKNSIRNEVVVCRDGAEALDYLLSTGPFSDRPVLEQPKVILLDLKLPKIDGLEVLKRIRAHPLLRRLPVVVLTTSREDQDMKASYDLGANSYVRKPVDFEEFTATVKHLGLYWLKLNECPGMSG